MSTSATPGVRRSLADIQADYDSGNKAELETLMRAWKGIKDLPPADPRSFFMLGGHHGEPFGGPGATNPNWWGGYCQHGTVLFPSWHRAYLYLLEKALQSIPGCESVMLPFWDECSDASRQNGIPSALTDEFFTLDGQQIPNPLRSFILPVDIVDNVQGDNALYSKAAGYETVRYPLSGLVGTPADRAATAAHNALYPDYGDNVATLNTNITTWLNTQFMLAGRLRGQIAYRFQQCLDAPNYTLFSNMTSMQQWNNLYPDNLVCALENPHNFMHLAVGGFDVPGQGNASLIPGANGDMGENDTAALDPIFYFHHCFIDYAFWIWQRRHGATDSFTINPTDPGAVYSPGNNQPPNGADPSAGMDMNTALDPFKKADGTPFSTSDCVNIETQLGYSYGPGSLDAYVVTQAMLAETAPARAPDEKTVHVAGIDRTKIRGSFLIAAYAEIDGERQLIGIDPVLSRWHVAGCANCQNHLTVSSDFRLPGEGVSVTVEVHTRDGLASAGRASRGGAAEAHMLTQADIAAAPAAFTIELR
jgi:tyrosinase